MSKLKISYDKIASSYKVIIFDNDGVIIDSNHSKTQAFVDALSGEDPVLIDQFIGYHKKFGGVSRYEKINYYFESIKNSSHSEDDIARVLMSYAELARKALLESDLLPGVELFLRRLHSAKIKLHVVSGSDRDELVDVYKVRGIYKCFDSICGSPESKEDIVKSLDTEGCLPRPGAYFGDAFLDYDVASSLGMDFFFVESKSEWYDGVEFCAENHCNIISDFKDILY